MIRSMTGFGRGTYQNNRFTIDVVVATVNHRFLDIQLRLPDELVAAEPQVRGLVLQYCQRGRINVSVTLKHTGEIAYQLNRPMIRGYLGAVAMMKQEFSIGGELDINTLASLPDVIEPVSQSGELETELVAGLDAAMKQALESVAEMRAVEGRAIAQEMYERLNVITNLVADIERDARSNLAIARERLLRRVHELAADITLDEGRVAQEVVLLAQRSDINEEINRLKSHLDQYRALLGSDQANGRKLEFLLQEMNREGTTIQSKSPSIATAKAAIELRAEVEKLREQVQNVE
ncbi:MAG: YicC/YloC family endoribonuclease [Acidobacteriota bacterium]|nr:YicC family protein [Blastocatellia bacterium]MDW8238592.1 YicC/YloC family endoribonuclease [Acidobacteriota bacterium]